MTAYLYAAIAVVGVVIGALLMHLFDSSRYAALQHSYDAYTAKMDRQHVLDQKAVTEVLEEQVQAFKRISKENDSVVQELNAKLAAADAARASDRAIASRLFHDAAACSASGGAVPKGADQPGSPQPARKASLDELANTCSDLATEDERNADKLDALIKQVKGNL